MKPIFALTLCDSEFPYSMDSKYESQVVRTGLGIASKCVSFQEKKKKKKKPKEKILKEESNG